jgi:hypothetical protein
MAEKNLESRSPTTTGLRAWLGAAVILGAAGLSTEAGAQYYYYPQPQPQYRYYQQPQVYVPPRVARKQAQQQRRFIEKYGYQNPQQGYYYQRPQQQYYGPRYEYGPGYRYNAPVQSPYGTTTPGS